MVAVEAERRGGIQETWEEYQSKRNCPIEKDHGSAESRTTSGSQVQQTQRVVVLPGTDVRVLDKGTSFWPLSWEGDFRSWDSPK